MKIKDIASENRPLERLENNGCEALSNVELLAIIINRGTKETNAIDLANIIFNKYSLENLENCTLTELRQIKGIGKVKAAQIKAVLELHKRFSVNKKEVNLKIYNPQQVYEILKGDLENKTQEILYAIYLRGDNTITKKIIAMGTYDQSYIPHKEIIAFALKENAKGIILAHNHPSGFLEPSNEDKQSTQKIAKIAKNLDMELIDHIIITHEGFYSFRKNGLV
ncbi:MAG TPA: DNA repair protein RadC [archaeon]|nr:DNA repair protein RadC [archaeon]HRT03191.1 DNA repair protein RadC [Candidatus Diapherotrites archaeon]